jgi:hypothetical protein
MTPRLLLVLALAAAVATNIIANRRPGSQLRGPLGVIPERSNSRAPPPPATVVGRGQAACFTEGSGWQVAGVFAALGAPAKGQTASSLIASAPIAFNVANKNVPENVARLILFSMLASVSFSPYFASRSASSRYPISARANSTFRNRFTRYSQGESG